MIYVHTSEEGGKKQETVQFLQTIIIIIRNYFAKLSYLMYPMYHIIFRFSWLSTPHCIFIDQLRFSLSFCTAMHILYFYFPIFHGQFLQFQQFSNKTKNNRIKCNLNSSNEKSIYQLIKKIPAYPRLLLYFLIVKTMCSC